ncbi:cell wall-binding repeat-containing protein [Herbiconiux sp.]|uniref:cell wall-binding repeat-containing protein n=1 Tax=Herbiconiux sp. TaxID=1871186 RepID=UPI0025B85211|nr:cell wall-binding repeat-containing protein [Herbiconiux sp.]
MPRKPLLATLLIGAAVLTPVGAATATPHEAAPREIVPLCVDFPVEHPGVTRIGGADRFALSAAVSASTFIDSGGTVYIASGATFPDALSGSAAAGFEGGPVLLVTRDTVSPQVKAELQRLKPHKIVVLGGENTISQALEFSLEAYAPEIVRHGGADRFEVSAKIATATFQHVSWTAYVATGSGFADALSASAAAGNDRGPVLLVGQDSIPTATLQALADAPALDRIVVVGGTNSISDAVFTQLAAIARTTRISGTDRFAVSATTSAKTFCADAQTVYVASGAVFPDALSGSAAAIHDGAPVLLVTSDTIPAPVAAELRRLNPQGIVVLGGPNTVSDKVVNDLKGYLRP